MSGRALLLFHTRTPGITAYTVTIIHHGPATHGRAFMTEQGFSRKQGLPQYGVVYSTLKDERFMFVSWLVPHFICMKTHCCRWNSGHHSVFVYPDSGYLEADLLKLQATGLNTELCNFIFLPFKSIDLSMSWMFWCICGNECNVNMLWSSMFFFWCCQYLLSIRTAVQLISFNKWLISGFCSFEHRGGWGNMVWP